MLKEKKVFQFKVDGELCHYLMPSWFMLHFGFIIWMISELFFEE
mgnify:CR=1 FL=1